MNINYSFEQKIMKESEKLKGKLTFIILSPTLISGARTAQALVDEALKAVQRSVKDKLNGRGGVSSLNLPSIESLDRIKLIYLINKHIMLQLLIHINHCIFSNEARTVCLKL